MNSFSEVQVLHMSGMAIILFFSIIGSVHFIITKDKAYLFYSLHLALTLFGIGAGFNILPGELIKPSPFQGYIGILLYPIFTVYFLNLENKSLLSRLCYFLTFFVGIYLILNYILELFLPAFYIQLLYNIVALVCFGVWLKVLIILFKHKDIISRLYLLGTLGAWTFLLITNILFINNEPSNGIFDNPYFYSVLAFVWEAVWFSANLAYRSHLTDLKYKNMLENKIEYEYQLNQEHDQITKDMHDDLGSSLSALGLTTDLVRHKTIDTGILNELKKINELSQSLSEYLREIILVTSFRNNKIENLIAFMQQHILNSFENSEILIDLRIQDEIPSVTISSIIRKKFYFAFKRLINELVVIDNIENVQILFEVQNMELVIMTRAYPFDVKNVNLLEQEKIQDTILYIQNSLSIIQGKCTVKYLTNHILFVKLSIALPITM